MSDVTTQRLVAVAAASALGSSLLTYTVLKLRAARIRHQQPKQREIGSAHVPSNGELAADSLGDPYDPSAREGYLNWEDYFMAVAFLSAQRSKDPNKQVGACIVDRTNVICGIGYNGFPRGCSDSQLPWAKKSRGGDPLETKYPYVCHAEMNAILNKNGASVVGARVYVTMFPCNECAKLMIQAGISEIVYHEAKDQPARSDSPLVTAKFNRDQQYAASRRLLALAGVKLRQHSFRRPVLLRLTNDSKRPASLEPHDSACSSRSASLGVGVQAPPLAPAGAADLQHSGTETGGGDGGGNCSSLTASEPPMVPALAAILDLRHQASVLDDTFGTHFAQMAAASEASCAATAAAQAADRVEAAAAEALAVAEAADASAAGVQGASVANGRRRRRRGRRQSAQAASEGAGVIVQQD